MREIQLSKLLSLVLRHDPARLGLTLDAAGWVPVPELLTALAASGNQVSRRELEQVVAGSDKQRFSLDAERDRIRANQGHSVPVDLGLIPTRPPARLYHGTSTRNLDSIFATGLSPRQRHAVHLSADPATAARVGARRGPHTVLDIDAAAMYADGHRFTVSANGVWLVDSVPPRYLSRPD